MKLKLTVALVGAQILSFYSMAESDKNYPDPVSNPGSPVMLVGDWFDDPHQIDVNKLPKLPRDSAVISDVNGRKGVMQHNYIVYFDGKFWVMWSDGPSISDEAGPGLEDRAGQVVMYSTSEDGLSWSEPKLLSGYPPESSPDSPLYNTRDPKGKRYIARGFWLREEGELLALASLDEASGFFGPGLELVAFRWNPEAESWDNLGAIEDDAINNFPPKQLPTGEWMMSRRKHDYKNSGVDVLIGGVDGIDDWTAFPIPQNSKLKAEEPYWWVLPDGNLMALFRDNHRSGYLYRSFSTDNGRTWSMPTLTDFPDARSKFHGLRLKDGRYVLVSNSQPWERDYLTLAVSDDGVVFDRLYHLVTGEQNGVDYPMVMEHDGYLYIVHSGGVGRRKQSIEIERVKLDDLNEMEMSDARLEPVILPSAEPEMTVEVEGDWVRSDKSDEKLGEDYFAMAPGGKGKVTFTTTLPAAGKYEVYAWWNSRGQRHGAVPYVIQQNGEDKLVRVNQREQGGQWVSLGTYSFEAGAASVSVIAEGKPTWVVADAVYFRSIEN